MRSSFLAFSLLLLAFPISLFAASTDADAVLNRCGTPLKDFISADSSNSAEQQRVLTYPKAELHFEHADSGWNFIFASHGTRSGLDRTKVEEVMPCFGKAMYDVQLALSAGPIAQPSAAPVSLTGLQRFQLLIQRIHLASPYVLGLLVFLYLIPTIIGVFRSPIHLAALVMLDLFLGWTIVGWVFALVLAFGERESEPAKPAPVADPPPQRGFDFFDSTSPSDPNILRPTAFHTAPSAQGFRPEKPRSLLRFSTPPRPKPPASTAPPTPEITWYENYRPSTPVRIEYTEGPRRVGVLDINLCCRGTDPQGTEYIGYYSGKTVVALRADRILRIRSTNIA